MAINTNSKAYQGLLDKGYTASEIQQMANAVSSGKTTQQAFDEVKSQRASAQSTPAQTTQKTNYQTITYNGQVSDNKGGTANMNSMSQNKAIDNSRNFQVGTGDVVDMPQQPKAQSVATQSNNLAKAWQGLDYETQQKKLNSIAGLKDALAKKGITSKTAPTTTQTTTTPKRTTQVQTPKQDQWDYQDNSQGRMNQIADNLNGYRQTMPQLFDDMSAFYNFFIKDKGRSQDQIDFLWDYYERVQKYGKYDNMSPEQLGTGIANGDIPEDYLNTLKSTDPQKYQEVITAKQNREDTIKNESFLNDAATMAGIEGWESEPSSIQYGKWNGIWMDEDSNGIDDRREHYASEEEKGYQKQIADLNAANLDIDNTVKHDYEDLVKKYPGATKATLMAMAQDQNAKLLREKENNLVELTRLQGYVGYMQEERKEMNAAGADSIRQLQDNLKMYYDYSPEGIAELAQAKYAATNITLDQADSGNETQKQMALQSVLDDYYAKYGSIIQRSEQQVINDVIAYAKKNGIGLAQALQENFVKPLQQKPGFAQLNSITASNPDVFKIGDDTYGYWDSDGNLVPIGSGVVGTGTGTMRTERNNNPTAMTTDVAKSLGGVEGVDYVKGDSFQTADGRTLYTAKLIGDPIETTIKLLDNAANTGRGAFYTKGGAKRWTHTAMSDAEWLKLSPEEKKNVVLKMLQREGGDISKMAGYNQGGGEGVGGGQLYNPALTQIFKQWEDKPDTANAVKDFWNTYGDEVAAAGVSKEDFLKQYDERYEEQSADAYLDILSHLDQLIELTGDERDLGERFSTIFGIGDVGAAYDYIKNNLTVQGLRDAKAQGLRLGVLSDSDVRMIGKAATTLSWMQGQKSWNKELNSFREKLLSKNKYLRDRYQNKSAYSNNKTISFDEGDRSFTIGNSSSNTNTTKTKDIKDLGKVGKRMPEF